MTTFGTYKGTYGTFAEIKLAVESGTLTHGEAAQACERLIRLHLAADPRLREVYRPAGVQA